MRLYAILCYAIAATAETGGLVFVVLALRENRAIVQRWLAANPNENAGGSWGQILLVNQVVLSLIGNPWRGRTAAALIALGIIAGTLGNFASLPN